MNKYKWKFGAFEPQFLSKRPLDLCLRAPVTVQSRENMNKVKTKTNILGCCWPISAAVEAGGDAEVFSAVMQ